MANDIMNDGRALAVQIAVHSDTGVCEHVSKQHHSGEQHT